MKVFPHSDKSESFKQNSKSFLQVLISSLKLKKYPISLDIQEINEFLTCLNRQQKVILTPAYKKKAKDKEKQRTQYEYIQIYNIRDNQTKFKRRPTRKRTNKNDRINTENRLSQSIVNQKQQHQKLMFFVEQSLCLNCLVYSMTQSQRIHLCFGIKKQGIQTNNEEFLQSNWQLDMIDEKIIKPVQINSEIKKIFIEQFSEQNHSLSPFCSLRSLVIEVHQQSLNFQQWVLSMKIIGQLVKFIENQNLISLQKLQINIYERKYSQPQGNPIIDGLLETIYLGLHKIINSKNCSGYTYCPKLNQLSFNPTLYLRSWEKWRQNLSKIGEQKNKQVNPIEILSLIQLPPSINNEIYFLELLNKIFGNFHKITHLTLQMSSSYPQNQFKLFNLLCSELYKFSPYLQFLSIHTNDETLDKQPALRSILQLYPYLSDLKIKMCPCSISKNQHQKQWVYMNQILWRRLHIQRLVNLVRILERKGYQRYQCMGVMEFMKPLKFPLNSGSSIK